MTRFKTLILAAFLGTASILAPATAGTMTDAQKQEMGEFIRSYLLEHPELVREMAQKLEDKDRQEEEQARADGLVSEKAFIFHHTGDAVVGDTKGDVTLVEFMDYNCGWCKRSVGEVQALVAKDPKLKVVLKEFPIFGKHSEFAAKAALASVKQGKYWPFHQAMFAHEGEVTTDVVRQIAAEQGIDVAQMEKDMESKDVLDTISANYDLAKKLKLSGTPAFIVDDQLFPGYMQLTDLEAAITQVRENGGCKLC